MSGGEAALSLKKIFKRVKAALRSKHLPGIDESTSYGTPSLRAGGKLMVRVKDNDTLVLLCPLEEKEMLMAAEPAIYFETDHYKGWPAVLVRMSKIGDAELRHRLERCWRYRAPKRLVAQFDGAITASKKPSRGKRRT